ncbi:unnamed protein product [Fraxinus pennsylvanica]|uniref:Terpene synthase metal-binding domain-containing protein n=1 Tax=Fraxinus pennsylvanica TaxID=56036 RepID=A0AAD1ZM14_9LAMI|nr:unnamed protein product [Fraxinus pennsylvanica]
MKHLNDQTSIDQFHSRLVHHGLELPLQWTIPRAEARWFINVYKDRPDMNPVLLELAELDFNIVEAKYQQELKHLSRKILTKVNVLVTTIDDIYDVYGTLDELEVFTRIIERIISGACVDYNFISCFQDEMKRGDVPKTIQCYMKETGASEDEARKHIRSSIRETWKRMNKVQETSCPFSKTFIEITVNLARMARYRYPYGDGHGIRNHETKARILALLFEPI